MAKIQRIGRNSTENAVSLAAGLSDRVEIPDGVKLRSDEELVIWEQFTRTRAREDWSAFELLLVAKAVRVEADIRKHQEELDAMGVTLVNERGTQIVNPLLSVVDSLQRQQLSIIRSMSMNTKDSDPRTINAAGKAQNKLRATFSEIGDLIAKP